MIYWLDHARLELTEMIIHPCLFRKWPQSSEKILDNFLRQTFYPEQWQRLKFRLKQSSSSSTSFKLGHHEQQFHHSNFHIEQLSIDLSNGIRLARIIQLLFPEKFSITLLSQMKPGKDMDNVRKLFEQSIARNYRQQTLETLQSLMRIEFNLLIEQRYCLYLKQIVFIQRFIRCRNETRRLRNEFLLLRKSTITIQRWYRSKIAARKQRSNYNRIRQATIIIQRWYRCRHKKPLITIQRFWFGYRCRRQIYNKYPLLEIISINLGNLKQKKQPSTIIITIGMKTEKILKRMEKLTKNSMINNHHRMISDQFINDLNDLYRFTKYSFEIRYRLLQQWQIIIQWWIDLLKYQLITALIHIMYNHFNYPSLLTNSLYLINGLIDQNPDLIKQLSIDPKWKRLTNRIEGRYLQPLKMNNIVGGGGGGQQINQDSEQQQQCDECGIIQIIIKQIINKL
ncbi:hypothetical protein DERP_008013 [Dermatophagoides pteronyssinus]|uniref:Uncharacterized protein n=1 Tax=Dermatophagoides pteronyssinus TaxID=6956 RepID=A0ABQ8ITZ1_DERPT|nr:hypothetical protein DERP_008013 [Dermatophagoides pteronyssinus]